MGANLSVSDVERPMNKVVIVTGANSGLGLETAKLLALLGCKVIMACRSQERATKAIADINSACEKEGVTKPDLRFISLDLTSLQSVCDFVAEFKKTGLPLHYLICNAAVFGIEKSLTPDGYETHFQVNYLSHFLLTILLLPVVLTSGKDCRVVNVSAKLHPLASLEMDNMNGEMCYKRIGFYSKSKLYQLMNMYSLQKRLSYSDVIINSLHPGLIETNIQQSILDNTWMGWFYYGVKTVFSLPPLRYLLHRSGIMRDASKAALSIVYMAVSPQLAGMKAIYFDETVVRDTSSEASVFAIHEKLMAKIERVDCVPLPPCAKTLRNKTHRPYFISIVRGNVEAPHPADGLDPLNYYDRARTSAVIERVNKESQAKLWKYSMECLDRYIPEDIMKQLRLNEPDC